MTIFGESVYKYLFDELYSTVLPSSSLEGKRRPRLPSSARAKQPRKAEKCILMFYNLTIFTYPHAKMSQIHFLEIVQGCFPEYHRP